MGAMTSQTLAEACSRLATAAQGFAAELNAADGALGDGDLGITVSRGFAEASAEILPPDVGMAFMACAKAFQRVSSSSYGTLVATALMSAAKATRGRESVPMAEVPKLLQGALDAMMARGKGNLDDKTVLDSLQAVVTALGDVDDGHMLPVAIKTAQDTAEAFKGKPNKLGRARMFGTNSIGLVDPGQLAFCRLVEGLRRI